MLLPSLSLDRWLKSALHLIRNFRVLDWKAYFGIGLLGYIHRVDKSLLNYTGYLALTKFSLNIALFLSFTFSINNCFDLDTDRHSRHKLAKNPVAEGHISFVQGLAASLSIAILGLALSYIWFGGLSFIIYSMLTLLALIYSTPPFRLKAKPLLDLITHGLMLGGLLFIYGAILGGDIAPLSIILAFSTFVYSAILELRNHIEDYYSDASAGLKTTACFLGPEGSRKLLKAMLLLHLLLITLAMISVTQLIYPTPVTIPLALVDRRDRLMRTARFFDLITALAYSTVVLNRVMRLLGAV